MMDFAKFTKKGESFICLGDKFSGAIHVEGVSKGGTSAETIAAIVNFAKSNVRNIRKIIWDQGTQFTSEKYTEWAESMNIQVKHSTAYRAMNNQYAELVVKRVKNCIRETKEAHPHIKVNDYKLQMQLYDLMHENMECQEATAHQAI